MKRSRRLLGLRHKARVYVNGVLKGESKWSNLILDNFGVWLAGLIRAPVDATLTVSLTDDGGTARSVGVYCAAAAADAVFNRSTAGTPPVGTQIKIGSGTTAPARGDTDIETAFLTAPESDAFDTGSGSYAAGAITFSGSITAGGSGTINETGFFGKWVYTTVSPYTALFMLFHDAISPGVAFSAGDSITVEYVISL